VKYLVDASGILAALKVEPGAGRVAEIAIDAGLTSINLAEVVDKLVRTGTSAEGIGQIVRDLNVHILPVDHSDAVEAGLLRNELRSAGLSLADAVCLAAARRRGLVVITADRIWGHVAPSVGVTVELIR
jgi:ribonuclease VapC